MHAAKICTKNYTNGKKSQVDTTWRSRLLTQTVSTSSSLPVSGSSLLERRLRSARMSPVPTSLCITVNGLYCTPTENLSRFCKIFAIFRINCFPVWNN